MKTYGRAADNPCTAPPQAASAWGLSLRKGICAVFRSGLFLPHESLHSCILLIARFKLGNRGTRGAGRFAFGIAAARLLPWSLTDVGPAASSPPAVWAAWVFCLLKLSWHAAGERRVGKESAATSLNTGGAKDRRLDQRRAKAEMHAVRVAAGADRRSRTKVAASGLQRPPTPSAMTTRRQRAERNCSG